MDAPSSADPRRQPATSSIIGHGFLAVLLLWLVIPFALHGRVAQDAIPYVAVGKLARHHPNEVYAAQNGDLFNLSPSYQRQWCELAPVGTDCENLAVAYVSTPPVLPLTMVLADLGAGLGTLVMQLGASCMLIGGMWLLWKRLAHRTRHSPELLLVTALALTPMAMVPIGLGQTSPIMFLSVCLGISTPSVRRRIGVAATWTGAALIKLIPGALVLLLVARRRWRTLGIAAAISAILSVVTLAVVPLDTWGNFVRSALQLSGTSSTNPYNGSFNALLAHILPGSQAHGVGGAVVTAICLLAGAGICWFGMRKTSDDTRWAIGYVALLFMTPLVWWHYVWVAIGALAIVLAEQHRLDDRLLAILPAAAIVSIVPSIPNARGWSMPIPQALFLIAITVVTLALVARQRRQRAQRAVAAASSALL